MSNMFPDVLGLNPAEALPVLTASGFRVRERVTKPPWGSAPKGVCRIVCQKLVADNEVELVLAYQDYEKEVLKSGLQNNR